MSSPWLVSPDLDVYDVPDKPALKQLIIKLGIDRDNDAGNLRQLMGYATVKTDGLNARAGRFEANGWQLYYEGVGSTKSVQCIQKDGSDVVMPVVGDLDNRWRLAKVHAPDMDRRKLGRLLNAEIQKVKLANGIWRRGSLPAPATALLSGRRITTLQAAAWPPPHNNLPDYAGAQFQTGVAADACSSGSSSTLARASGSTGTPCTLGPSITPQVSSPCVRIFKIACPLTAALPVLSRSPLTDHDGAFGSHAFRPLWLPLPTAWAPPPRSDRLRHHM